MDNGKLATEGESKEREASAGLVLGGQHGPKSHCTDLNPVACYSPDILCNIHSDLHD
jgi:hypothetical protein